MRVCGLALAVARINSLPIRLSYCRRPAESAGLRYRKRMSRLRRIAVSDRYFFVTCNLREVERCLERLSLATCPVRLRKHVRDKGAHSLPGCSCLITGTQSFTHAIRLLFPVSSRRSSFAPPPQSNQRCQQSGPVWQGRFFDRVLRTIKEYWETVDYIHMNPVRRGLVNRPEEWRWSSIHAYQQTCYEVVLPIDQVNLPSDPDFRLW
jgi:REP element-mobilizing transposase RayT